MIDKLFLHLLLICVSWSREITEAVTDYGIRESSDNLVRQKRVISRIPGEDETMPISRVPYVVIIKQNMRFRCVGSILSHHVVITAAQCVAFSVASYKVVSGTARLERGTNHNVTDIKRNLGSHPHRPVDGIGLVTVNPPFEYGPSCYRIELHSAPLLPGTLGTISGWGYDNRTSDHGTSKPRGLRSIQVPIITHRDCVNRYRPNIQITDLDICTHHPQKYCGHIDAGVPLVIDGFLAGIHLWTGPDRLQLNPDFPDVFTVLQHSAYNHWIRSNI